MRWKKCLALLLASIFVLPTASIAASMNNNKYVELEVSKDEVKVYEVVDFEAKFNIVTSQAGHPYSYKFKFYFGDGKTKTVYSSENTCQVSHVYESPGIYKAKVSVMYDGEVYWSDKVKITVSQQNKIPIAMFSFYPQEPCIGDVVSFDASQSYDPDGSIVSYTWDFGDGSYGYGWIVKHEYEQPGVYRVTLRVTDDKGASAETSAWVNVREKEYEVDLQVDKQQAKVGEEITARVQVSEKAGVSALASYETHAQQLFRFMFHWGDGSVDTLYGSKEATDKHIFETSGEYLLTVEVYHGDTLIGMKNAEITIIETDNCQDELDFSIEEVSYEPSPPDKGEKITFYVKLGWDGPDLPSGTAPPILAVSLDGYEKDKKFVDRKDFNDIQTLSFIWPQDMKLHLVEIIIDKGDAFDETDESNNVWRRILSTPIPSQESSLSIGDVHLSVKKEILVGEKVELFISIGDRISSQSVENDNILHIGKFYHYSVDWGDGSSLTSLSSKRETKVYHRYEKTGIFTIRVKVYNKDKSVMKETSATVRVVEAEKESSSVSKDLQVKVKIVSPKEEIHAGDKVSVRIDVSKQGGNDGGSSSGLDKSDRSRTRGSLFTRILDILRDIFNRRRPSSKVSALFAERNRNMEKTNLYRYSVSWGDGEKKTIIGGKSLTVTHIYANSGEYRFRVEVKDLSTNEKASASLRIFINDKLPLCNDDEPDQSQEKRDDYILFWDGTYLAQEFISNMDEITKVEIYVGKGLTVDNENVSESVDSLASSSPVKSEPISSSYSSLVVKIEVPFAGVSRSKEIPGSEIRRRGGWVTVDFSDDPMTNYAFTFFSYFRCRIVLIPKGGYFRWYYGENSPYAYGKGLISYDGEKWSRIVDEENGKGIDFCFKIYGRDWDETPDGTTDYYAIMWAGPAYATGKCRSSYATSRMGQTLVNHGWSYSNIHVIDGRIADLDKLSDFVITLRELDRVERSDDIFMFYYFGHNDFVTFVDEEEGFAKQIHSLKFMDSYMGRLASAQCVILDCCASGSLAYRAVNENRVILASTTGNEYSYCGPDVGPLFTAAIIEAIEEKGYKTAEDIFYKYARDRTIELSREYSNVYKPQVPQIIDNYDGNLQIIPN